MQSMSTPRLSPSSYLVLGYVSLLGKPTTYDISRHVSDSVGEFWPFPQSQLYAETARLAAAGLLHEDREEGGRHRRHYSITEEGRQALTDWLGDPNTETPELRNPGLLKLFFSELVSTEQVVALARTQAEWFRQKVAEYQAIVDRFGDRPRLARRVATARLGVAYAQAFMDFWTDVAEHPPEAAPSD
jgi:PadR family transcriptional regulator, regulatory protein AphA